MPKKKKIPKPLTYTEQQIGLMCVKISRLIADRKPIIDDLLAILVLTEQYIQEEEENE
jgi:hypothetical protein